MLTARALALAISALSLPVCAGGAGCHASPPEPVGEATITGATTDVADVAAPAGARAGGSAPAPQAARCPSAVAGATTTVAEVPGGIEVKVTGDRAVQGQIRQLSAGLASAGDETRGKHRANGGGMGRFGRCPVVMRNTHVEARDVPGGAAILVKPATLGELGWLRREVEARSAQLASPAAHGAGLMKACPSAVPNALTRVDDTSSGVVVRVTAKKPEDVAAVRDRAKAYSAHPSTADERCPEASTNAAPTIAFTSIPGGAALTLKAKTAADLDLFQRQARDRARDFEAPVE